MRGPHIAIDINDLHRAQSGIGRYICGLLAGMGEAPRSRDLTLFHKDPIHADLRTVTESPAFRCRAVPGRSETWWGQFSLPAAAGRAGANVLLCPSVRAPIVARIPVLLTVHDVIFKAHPEWYRRFDYRYMSSLYRALIPRVDRIIAVSEATRRDLLKHYRVPEDRIEVIHHGIERRFRPRDAEQARNHLEEAGIRVPERAVLCVGTLEPRKNVTRLIEAMRVLRRRGYPHTLVLAGKPGWLDEDLSRLVSAGTEENWILRMGHVPESALPLLYNVAEAVAYPSLYEGFGFPVLEAMASGIPVVASEAPGVTEVAGDSALKVDPFSVAELAGGLERVLDDDDLRSRLRQAGIHRASTFDWNETARRTLSVCERAVR